MYGTEWPWNRGVEEFHKAPVSRRAGSTAESVALAPRMQVLLNDGGEGAWDVRRYFQAVGANKPVGMGYLGL